MKEYIFNNQKVALWYQSYNLFYYYEDPPPSQTCELWHFADGDSHGRLIQALPKNVRTTFASVPAADRFRLEFRKDDASRSEILFEPSGDFKANLSGHILTLSSGGWDEALIVCSCWENENPHIFSQKVSLSGGKSIDIGALHTNAPIQEITVSPRRYPNIQGPAFVLNRKPPPVELEVSFKYSNDCLTIHYNIKNSYQIPDNIYTVLYSPNHTCPFSFIPVSKITWTDSKGVYIIKKPSTMLKVFVFADENIQVSAFRESSGVRSDLPLPAVDFIRFGSKLKNVLEADYQDTRHQVPKFKDSQKICPWLPDKLRTQSVEKLLEKRPGLVFYLYNLNMLYIIKDDNFVRYFMNVPVFILFSFFSALHSVYAELAKLEKASPTAHLKIDSIFSELYNNPNYIISLLRYIHYYHIIKKVNYRASDPPLAPRTLLAKLLPDDPELREWLAEKGNEEADLWLKCLDSGLTVEQLTLLRYVYDINIGTANAKQCIELIQYLRDTDIGDFHTCFYPKGELFADIIKINRLRETFLKEKKATFRQLQDLKAEIELFFGKVGYILEKLPEYRPKFQNLWQDCPQISEEFQHSPRNAIAILKEKAQVLQSQDLSEQIPPYLLESEPVELKLDELLLRRYELNRVQRWKQVTCFIKWLEDFQNAEGALPAWPVEASFENLEERAKDAWKDIYDQIRDYTEPDLKQLDTYLKLKPTLEKLRLQLAVYLEDAEKYIAISEDIPNAKLYQLIMTNVRNNADKIVLWLVCENVREAVKYQVTDYRQRRSQFSTVYREQIMLCLAQLNKMVNAPLTSLNNISDLLQQVYNIIELDDQAKEIWAQETQNIPDVLRNLLHIENYSDVDEIARIVENNYERVHRNLHREFDRMRSNYEKFAAKFHHVTGLEELNKLKKAVKTVSITTPRHYEIPCVVECFEAYEKMLKLKAHSAYIDKYSQNYNNAIDEIKRNYPQYLSKMCPTLAEEMRQKYIVYLENLACAEAWEEFASALVHAEKLAQVQAKRYDLLLESMQFNPQVAELLWLGQGDKLIQQLIKAEHASRDLTKLLSDNRKITEAISHLEAAEQLLERSYRDIRNIRGELIHELQERLNKLYKSTYKRQLTIEKSIVNNIEHSMQWLKEHLSHLGITSFGKLGPPFNAKPSASAPMSRDNLKQILKKYKLLPE